MGGEACAVVKLWHCTALHVAHEFFFWDGVRCSGILLLMIYVYPALLYIHANCWAGELN